jgi:hypothetical protein
MKSVLAVGLFTVTAAVLCAQDASGGGGSSSSGNTEKEILEVEQTFRDAAFKYDMQAFEHLLRLDFMLVDADGKLWTKRELPPGPKNPPKAKPILSAFKVRIYDDLAVVTGGETLPGPPEVATRFIHVWVKSEGKWGLSINQITQVKAPAKAPARAHTVPTAKK